GLRLRVREDLLTRFPAQPDAAGTVLGLLTGDRAGMSAEAWVRYARTGVTHLVAISGVHITMVAWLAGWLLQRAWLRWPRLAIRVPAARVAGLAGWLAACAYGALAGMGLPTQRTLLMLGVLVLMRWLPGEYPGRLILLAALAAVLAGDPLAVHSAGLWLSFLAVALLMTGGLSPSEERGWRAALRAQWLATWGLLPLTLALFARISSFSQPVNMIAIPWVTFAIVPMAMLGLLLQCLHEGAGVPAWRLAVWLMARLDAVLAWAAAWPGAAMDLALPGLSVLWLALALVLLLMPSALPGRALAFLPLLAVCWPWPALSPGQMRVTVLDAGQGLAVHVATARHGLVFDTGPPMGAHADAGSRVILPFLHWRGVRALDVLMLSHDDLDHTGGAGSLMQGLPVRQLLGVWPSILADWPASTRPPHMPCHAGRSWVWDGVRFDLLWPGDDPPSGDNNRSCVLRVEAGGQVVLIPGDLEAAGERVLLRGDHERLRADLLVLGHHGSKTSSTAAFLRAVRPREVIAAVGYRNRYHHPAPVVLRRLSALAMPGWRTDETGALSYDFLEAGRFPEVRRWRLVRGGYWLLPVSTADRSAGEAVSMLGALPVFP
ncbi:MAG: DNA internalization-related competence protein ComEC/Rec2, partial [Perlucidibaca sp.]